MRYKRLHFLLVYPLNTAPSQRFRFEQFFPLLDDLKISYSTNSFYTAGAYSNLYEKEKKALLLIQVALCYLRRCWHMFFLSGYDCILIQRGAAPVGPPFFEWVVRYIYRKPIIYDFDDAIWRGPSESKPRIRQLLKSGRKVSAICKWADKVVVGNRYLADYARQFNSNVVVIPTVIDTESRFTYTTYPNNSQPVIGWTGSHSTLPYLEALEDILLQVKAIHPFTLLVIANKPPKFKELDYRFVLWTEDAEVKELRMIDIGIMPLPDNDWTKGKCGFKAIQYMAIGRPAVVSAVGVNKEIVDHGINGYLCQNVEDWRKHLLALLIDIDLRVKMGSAARKKAATLFSLKRAAKQWLLVLKGA